MTERAPRRPRRPRDPSTRRTRLAPGQEYEPPPDGRVKRADYHLYMRSRAWQAKRWEWWRAAGKPSACAGCGARWSMGSGDLHHRTYDRLGHELVGDLVPVCGECHAAIHDRCKLWRDLERVTDLVLAERRR